MLVAWYGIDLMWADIVVWVLLAHFLSMIKVNGAVQIIPFTFCPNKRKYKGDVDIEQLHI